MASFLSGAAFGAAMIAAGVYQPSVVISQFKFEQFHMLQAFLGATASSAIIYKVAERLGYVSLKPRSSSPIGLFSNYDGNIIGGFLLGAGMGLTGSCPGTVLAQIGAGLQTGYNVLNGALIGSILWTGIVNKLVKAQKEKTGVQCQTSTLDEAAHIPKAAMFIAFQALCLAAIAASVVYSNGAADWTLFSAGSGIFMGLAQLFSILTRRSMLGVSTAYEEVGNYFWWLVKGADSKSRPAGYKNMVFATGVAAGAWALITAFPQFALPTLFETPAKWATIGGAMMVLGARIAGGCTSGHGISGLSLGSTASLVTIGTAFAAGGLVAPMVY